MFTDSHDISRLALENIIEPLTKGDIKRILNSIHANGGRLTYELKALAVSDVSIEKEQQKLRQLINILTDKINEDKNKLEESFSYLYLVENIPIRLSSPGLREYFEHKNTNKEFVCSLYLECPNPDEMKGPFDFECNLDTFTYYDMTFKNTLVLQHVLNALISNTLLCVLHHRKGYLEEYISLTLDNINKNIQHWYEWGVASDDLLGIIKEFGENMRKDIERLK
jgi:hypothetical protein